MFWWKYELIRIGQVATRQIVTAIVYTAFIGDLNALRILNLATEFEPIIFWNLIYTFSLNNHNSRNNFALLLSDLHFPTVDIVAASVDINIPQVSCPFLSITTRHFKEE